MAAILCVVISPVFAKVPAQTPGVQQSSTQELVQQGKIYYDTGQYTMSVKVLQQAAAEATAKRDDLRLATIWGNLCLAYQQLGLWKEAEQAIAQALNRLQIVNKSQQPVIRAKIFDVQGKLQFAQGKTETALITWQKAAEIYQQIGDKESLIRTRINSAQAMQVLGLYRQANKTLTELEQTLSKISDVSIKATGLRSLGNVLQVVGDLKRSQKVLKQSLAWAEASSDQAHSETLFSLGNTARAQQDTKAALNYYQQAIATSGNSSIRLQAQLNQLSLLVNTQSQIGSDLLPQIELEINKLPPSRMSVDARINLAHTLLILDDKQQSKIQNLKSKIAQLLVQAIKQAQNLQDKRAESYALGTLGELYEKTSQLQDAQKLSEKALVIAQSINASDIAYQWQWQLGRLRKQQLDIKGAIAYYLGAFNSLKSLRTDLVAMNPDIQFSFTQSVEPVYRNLVELLLQPSQPPQPPRNSGGQEGVGVNQENLQQARFVIESLQLAELDNFFRSACLDPQEAIDLLVDKKDQRAGVIYPIISPNRLDVILKLPNQPLRHYSTSINQEKVEIVVADMRKYLRDVTRTALMKERSQQVYDWLIRPAEAEFANSGIKTLVFVLDGVLRNIPMAALYDHNQQKYLIEKYAIALTPGLQLLAPKPFEKVQLKALTAGVAQERSIENLNFPPLKNVARELEKVKAKIPKTQQLLNQQFTEKNMQNQLQSNNFSVVHLATHGEFSSDPEKTFIVTWNELLKVKDFDHLLRVSDSSQSNNIELLVLSACKTAEGDKRAALGLAGVAVRAGARSTLATLWSVDDESTTNLMSEFYSELKAGVNKAEALQHAQLKAFAKQKSPYLWAPFVLVGNWL
ncbi:CHAT domain-containing protein [Iningainema sp. BLCCT55]|uniref:CHAT domain-containing protein n=2 Tax=Iningainema TaxID=1932705 RepID=A0A8J6XF17_9CYAN|nr:CHAT domain-containing protein [Iningainema tapete]MBD2775400.1 CHAT domain-containing protein [Iningainema tapete BLCC-T55]